ncbi:MAG: flagellar basal body protein [Desulfovibrionales bacterium]
MNISPSMEAIRAFSRSMEVTANNIANVNTDGFRFSRVHFEAGPGGEGVRAQDAQESSRSGGLVRRDEVMENADGGFEQHSTMVESSNTDLAEEMVHLNIDSTGMEANIATLRTMEETTGHILNLLV